jgi:hypothetical protein
VAGDAVGEFFFHFLSITGFLKACMFAV